MKIKDRVIDGIRLGDMKEEPCKKLSEVSLELNAEGSVLLRNSGMLPLKKGDKVAMFGRNQWHYLKSGTGSGGAVRTSYVTNIYDSLKKSGEIEINEELAEIYRKWEVENPFDAGNGWEMPWSQVEMPVNSEVCKNARAKSDKAIVVLSRTAGECKDNVEDKGSYLLSDDEYSLLKFVSESFDEVCVVLNVGNIIDMKWADELNIGTIIYVWQGGQDGGEAVADILLGKRYPSGKLTDTIASNITDYPSYEGYADIDDNFYKEDIYVGYRYFETFAKDKVVFPFGYGLGYTTFEYNIVSTKVENDKIVVCVNVKNTGDFVGKEVIQVYCEGVCDKLSRPSRELKAFAKTKELKVGETQELKISFAIKDMASYDDLGVTGNKSCYVLEKGVYNIYVGTDVRNAAKVMEYTKSETEVISRHKALFPIDVEFERMINNGGTVGFEKLSKGGNIETENVAELAPVDKKITLEDVYNGEASVEEFVATLNDLQLAIMSQGEGMNSPKVRPGTAGAFGGLTKELNDLKIPAICVSDGPSGLRLDNDDLATNIPNGTLIACSWNEELTEKLYVYEGIECYTHKVDGLLGPGMNIHRLPLCGRNFEYLSEDPYVSGAMAAAMCRGLDKAGVSATIKHFAANNKEYMRSRINMHISERALREIYLKGYEIAVKNSPVYMIMDAYNRINGVFCTANDDLNTKLLRDEWGYEGIVMTDWWPKNYINENNEDCVDRSLTVMVQNDLFMANPSAEVAAEEVLAGIEKGVVTRAQMQRNAVNICKAILKTPTFERMLDGEIIGAKDYDLTGRVPFVTINDVKSDTPFSLALDESCDYAVEIEYSSTKNELIQMPVKMYVGHNNGILLLFMVKGTKGKTEKTSAATYIINNGRQFKLDFDDEGITISKMNLYKI